MSRDSLENADFRKQTKGGGDSCLFCEYYVLSQDKKQARCRLHNVTFGDWFSAGEYVCRDFQESEWFGWSVDVLKNSSQSDSVTVTQSSYSNQRNSSAANKEGCYIATAVYGGYDKPEVLVLRQYRDNVLKKSWVGRLFINVYYTISPFLAQKLKKNSFVNRKVRKILDEIVRRVKDCEDTKRGSI